MSSEERINENTRSRREEMIPADKALEWYGIDKYEEVKAIWAEFYKGGQRYEAFTQWRHRPNMGKYYRVTEAGYRETRDPGSWPPAPEYFNIFFFGGSTAFQPGPAWTAVASYLQDILNADNMGRKVYVYNFGRSGYMSSQEVILFQELLKASYTPDIAVFMDGLNDFCYTDGKPGGWTNVAADYNRKIDDYLNTVAGYGVVTEWRYQRDFFKSLPLTRVLVAMVDRLLSEEITYKAPVAGEAPVETPADRKVLKSVITRYEDNMRIISASAKAFNVKPVFVWQPIPTYKYDPQFHMFYPSRMGCHINSVAGYPMMAENVAANPMGLDFIWAADMQEDMHEPLYIDAFHYTAPMAKKVAKLIADEMRNRQLIKAE